MKMRVENLFGEQADMNVPGPVKKDEVLDACFCLVRAFGLTEDTPTNTLTADFLWSHFKPGTTITDEYKKRLPKLVALARDCHKVARCDNPIGEYDWKVNKSAAAQTLKRYVIEYFRAAHS